MRTGVLCDAGPLVALLNRRDRHHRWVSDLLRDVRPPIKTCEAVLAEAWHLLGRASGGRRRLVGLVRAGLVLPAFDLGSEIESVEVLLDRYADVPMSLADACLVRMAEIAPSYLLMTCDSDFEVYRAHRTKALAVEVPWR